MKLLTHISEGLRNLFTSKLRSLLALLGILVGTASVVAMVSSGKLAENEALKQFKTLGTDLLAVTLQHLESSEQHDSPESALSISQAADVVKANSDILIAAPYTQVFNSIQFDGHEINGRVLGVTSAFSTVANIKMAAGRFISNLDDYAYFCVVGQSVYHHIKENTLSNPIGQQIQIGKTFFTIAGVSQHWPESSFLYANIDDSIMIPASTSMLLSKYVTVNNIIMRLSPHADIENVKISIENYLHDLSPNSTFLFRSAKELIAHMAKQNEIFTVFLGLIGGISLLVGGIGVMNIMLVSIIERKREIGIRRAVGATRQDIRHLFLVEALMLSLLGGGLGAFIGIVIAYFISLFWHWSFTLFLMPPLIGFTVSAATGIFFGFYPAHKASCLDPIETLRSV